MRAILPWEEDIPSQEQFEKLTEVLKAKYSRKGGKRKSKGKERIQTKVEIILDTCNVCLLRRRLVGQIFRKFTLSQLQG